MKKIIKVFNSSLVFVAALTFFASCQSTNVENSNVAQSNESTQKTENSTKNESTIQFKKDVQDMELLLVSAPNAPNAGAAFTKPFVVSVKNKSGVPYSNYTLTVNYPTAKENNIVSFASSEIQTDQNGIASFTPESISTSINSTITFAPKSPSNNPTFVKLAESIALEVPCQVKFNLPKGKLVMVYLVDYDQKGRMNINTTPSTSSNLLQEIWKRGYPYQAQNGPDLHKSIDADSDALLLQAKKLIGGGSSYFKYFVFGKVKYESPVTQVENGYSVTLTATITAVDFQTGKEIITLTKSLTSTDKNQWSVVNACQLQLAKELADELVYSL